jgi:hypothetical protein
MGKHPPASPLLPRTTVARAHAHPPCAPAPHLAPHRELNKLAEPSPLPSACSLLHTRHNASSHQHIARVAQAASAASLTRFFFSYPRRPLRAAGDSSPGYSDSEGRSLDDILCPPLRTIGHFEDAVVPVPSFSPKQPTPYVLCWVPASQPRPEINLLSPRVNVDASPASLLMCRRTCHAPNLTSRSERVAAMVARVAVGSLLTGWGRGSTQLTPTHQLTHPPTHAPTSRCNLRAHRMRGSSSMLYMSQQRAHTHVGEEARAAVPMEIMGTPPMAHRKMTTVSA